jgi:hypothetical protein
VSACVKQLCRTLPRSGNKKVMVSTIEKIVEAATRSRGPAVCMQLSNHVEAGRTTCREHLNETKFRKAGLGPGANRR